MTPALSVRGLNAYYGKSQVVFDLDLYAGVGEIVVILGRNGVGKTSAMLAIAGETPISALTARFVELALHGVDLKALPSFRRVRAGLSFVPSGARVFGDLTVHENLSMVSGSTAPGRWDISAVYDTFPPLAKLRASKGRQLSGGERQMLALGRALLANPRVLMLDEPSEGLAPIVVRHLGEIVKRLAAEDIAILLTEQSHELALSLADRAYYLDKGHVVWAGESDVAREPEIVSRYLAV